MVDCRKPAPLLDLRRLAYVSTAVACDSERMRRVGEIGISPRRRGRVIVGRMVESISRREPVSR